MTESMLSTVDNPFNPFHEFDEWYAYDQARGYGSLSLLSRIAIVSDELSDAQYSQAIEDAIDEIVKENVSGMHCRVYADTDTHSNHNENRIVARDQ